MTDHSETVQILYEISLSIGHEDSVAETARTALSAYLRKLDCPAGAVLERVSRPGGDTYDPVAAIPAKPTINDAYREAVEEIPDGDDGAFTESLPRVVDVAGPRRVHLFDLPGFGLLVLVTTTDHGVDDAFDALRSLNQKLADACRAVRDEQRVRTERNRFQAVFQTIPEPAVNVVVEDGTVVVNDVNAAFADTFGETASAAQGRSLEACLSGVGDTDPPGEWAFADGAAEIEVRRETTAGPRTFLLRTAPVSTDGERREWFGLYVDVSAQRRRERTLTDLHRAANELLNSDDVTEVCETAVAAAADVLDFDVCGVHLYNRTRQALVPEATTGAVGSDDADLCYTDTETVVWRVYRSDEGVRIDDLETFEGNLPNDDTDAGSAMVLPLGTHGVFIASSTARKAFDESDMDMARLLMTILQRALDRVGRERAFQEINATTEALVGGEGVEDVARTLVERAQHVLDLPYVTVWEHDPADAGLVPLATSSKSRELLGTIPAFGPGQSIVWRVFANGDPEVVQNVGAAPGAYDETSDIRSELLVPIGEFGVIAAGSTEPGDFSRTEFELLQTLVTSAESALRLVDRQRELETLDEILTRVLRHNVRNDLTVIRGRAELIAQEATGSNATHAADLVRSSENLLSTTSMARRIREVIDRREQRSETDVNDLVDDVVAEVRTEFDAATVAVDHDATATLELHPNFEYAVRQALVNGIEHNDEQPRVEVTVDRTGTSVVVRIGDDGPGISDAEVTPIRNGEEGALSHGSGLGLWIIDRVVSYSGGAVRFDADADGTSVTMEFDTEAR